MASIIYSPKDIFEQNLKPVCVAMIRKKWMNSLMTSSRIMKSYISQVQELRAENEKIKQQLASKPKSAPNTILCWFTYS